MNHLARNWPVYILLVGFIWLVAKVCINSYKEEKKDQEQKKLQGGKDQAGKK